MKTIYRYLLIAIFVATITSCDEVSTTEPKKDDGGKQSNDWLIPSNKVFDGGPGKDGIPALQDPNFIDVDAIDYVADNDLVIAVKVGNEIRVYPHSILDWHEIINDGIGSTKYALTYCPLTGSGIGWNRVIDGNETTFGVSGLLYNTNLIPYDRATGSNWSQMQLQSVNGKLISKFISLVPLIESKWSTIKTSFPNAKVVSTNTGYSRNYGRYPYGDYRTNHTSLIFPVEHSDDRLKGKERVLGVFDGENTKAYRVESFETNGQVLIEKFASTNFLIYGNSGKNFITAFTIPNNSTFEIITSDLPWIFKDSNGNKYDLFGTSEDKSIQLTPAKSFIAYWFSWAAFYQNTKLYK
ncbi:MAG: DUF3179 domain-containing protein [Melioribacteraceae bacterium]